jgi:putative phage-type endonuclease
MTAIDERPATRRVTPTARLVLPADAARSAWLRERLRGLGSSDIAAIMGVSTHRTAAHVYYEKRGELPLDAPAGEAALWGTLHEETVAREWARRNNTVVRRVGLVAHVDDPEKMCTLDRQCRECPVSPEQREACALEIKTRSAWLAGKWRKGVPDDVLAQCLWQIIVTGYDHIHVAVLIGGNDYRQFVVHRSEHAGLIANIITVADDLWNNCVLAGLPPEPSGDEPPDAMLDLYGQLHPNRQGLVHLDRELAALDALGEYVDASKAWTAADKAKKSAKARLYGFLGGAQAAVMNSDLAYSIEWTNKKSVDLEHLQEAWPEAYADCVHDGGHDRLNIPAKIRKEYSA